MDAAPHVKAELDAELERLAKQVCLFFLIFLHSYSFLFFPRILLLPKKTADLAGSGKLTLRNKYSRRPPSNLLHLAYYYVSVKKYRYLHCEKDTAKFFN